MADDSTDRPERSGPLAPTAGPDDGHEASLRPRRLEQYFGQDRIKESLRISIEAARLREEPLDHLLFHGPPGLGKTTLAMIVAAEMGVSIRITSGPAIERAGDLASLLTSLQAGDILFIDEIHRLALPVEEVLYPAMEDFSVDIMLGKGPKARDVRLKLNRFTLVGATTRAGLLTSPLRARWRTSMSVSGLWNSTAVWMEEPMGDLSGNRSWTWSPISS